MDFESYLSQLGEIYEEQGQSLLVSKGATSKEVISLEQVLGFPLDDHLKSAWQYANGSRSNQTIFARKDFFTGYEFLSIKDALAQREGMKRRSPQYAEYSQPEPRDARIEEGWFQPGWLPFASFGGATLLLIVDYSPRKGKPGQIIAFTHDPDTIDFVCNDFTHLLKESIKQISSEPEEYIY